MMETMSPRNLRSMSSGTDVLSMSAKSARTTLPHANPPPAYVSEVEAENLTYAEIEKPVKISEGALRLVNGFLDQILYDILSRSHSTSLSAIRAAIPIVLKQRLGRSAVQAADEELQDYIDEGEMDEVLFTPATLDPRAEFDVDLAWKLTRLRCMVYAKLGDMEEEDEEEYLEDDDLRDHVDRVKYTIRSSATIAPPAAIFLTTVLEFLAEQALCIAAQHARKRHLPSKESNGEVLPNHLPRDDQDGIYLEEIDMSGIGKEGPLIRLWRSWKGTVRAGGGSMSSRPATPSVMSLSSPESPGYEWKSPSAPPISTIQEERSPSIQPTRSPPPAKIPLPMGDNDIEEIEVPGLANTFEEDVDDTAAERPGPPERRPSSMLIMPGKFSDLAIAEGDGAAERPTYHRRRSRSLPTTTANPTKSRSTTAANKAESPSAAERLDDDVSHPPKEQHDSSLRSNALSTAVASIAGALSVEASRAFRRDRPAQDAPVAASPTSAVETVHGNEAALPNGEDHQDPEDLALSSVDEGEEPVDNHTTLRDSGFGVAGSQEELPAHGPVDHTAEEDLSTAHDAQISATPDVVQTQNTAQEVSERNPDELNAASNTSTGTATQNNDMGSATIYEMDRSNVPVADSTIRQPETSGAPVTSAWPVVIHKRTSSLENQTTGRSPTETRFPQHIPAPQFSSGAGKLNNPGQDRVPRYATSSFATSHNGSAASNLAQATAPHSRTTSTAKDGRPSTAGSATARRQHIRLRSDTDENAWLANQPDDLDRAKKSLDVLIDSDETLHYTLTPKSAREGSKSKVKSQTQELADFFRNTAPPGEEVSRPKSSRSAKDALIGFRANGPASPKLPIPINAQVNPSPPKVQQSLNSPPRHKNPLGEPRDARMARSTTRDLADYARSTGPENEMQLPKPLGNRPNTAQGGRKADGPSGAAESSPGDSRPSTTSGKPASRLKYLARDPRAPRTTESSDLIDFIREGPPRQAGDHRIDRKVAPFRTTMDSDDLNALAPPPELDANGRNSDGSAQESAMTVKSMVSSMNSRTGLLDSTNRPAGKFTNGFNSSANAVTKQPIIPESDGMPKRTRRRVRDPYAIDFSDDEDELEDISVPPQRRGDEESLVDFLRNTAPPPGMTTKPILAALPNPTQPNASAMVSPTTSASRFKDYLQGSSPTKNGATTKSTNGARAESPHLTQAGSKMDKYRPTQPTHASHVERNRQRMRAEPRGATISPGGDTADLAAYLKNSGPPPSSEAPIQKFGTTGKDQAGFLRFFQRRGSTRK